MSNNVINAEFNQNNPPEIKVETLQEALEVLDQEKVKLSYDLMMAQRNAALNNSAASVVGEKFGIKSVTLQNMLAAQNAQKRLLLQAYELIIAELKAKTAETTGD